MSFLPALSRRAVVVASLVMSAGAVGVAGCGSGDSGAADSDKPVVAATAPQVDGMVRQLAGDGVTVASVVAATADVHELELRPSQVKALKAADLILQPGRGNDAWAKEAIDAIDARKVDLSADLPGRHRHWWMDPAAAEAAAKQIARELDTLDPRGAAVRDGRLGQVVLGLRVIDEETKQCLDSVPTAGRVIVTDHDAIGAFAERYDLTIAGTIAPGAEPEASPSAQRIVELIDTMKAKGVAAVFPIAPHGSELSASVAKRGGAVLGGALWADALPGGAHAHGHEAEADEADVAGESAPTLETAAHLNAQSVAKALGAKPAACGDLLP